MPTKVCDMSEPTFSSVGQLLKGPLAQRGESVELLNLVSDTKVKQIKKRVTVFFGR